MAPPRRPMRLAAWLLAVALGTGACDDGRSRQAARSRPNTSTSAPAATTTTAATAPASTTTVTTAPTLPPVPLFPEGVPGSPMAGFVAFGDFGGGPAQRAVAAAMVRWATGHRVDALVTTGDNVYDYGEPHLFVAHLDEPYRQLRAAGRPMWVTLGNHDVVSGHGPAQLAHLGLPPLPYTATLPGVRLFFLDGNRPDAAQANWLREQLRSPAPTFSVVVFHQPVYSCGIHGPTPDIVANWAPVFEEHRVSLVLTGHDHQYSRFVSGNGVTYIVTGGGGRGLYPLQAGCAPPELKTAAVRHHFTGVEVYPDRLVLTAVADDDSVLDRTEIPAPAAAPVPVG